MKSKILAFLLALVAVVVLPAASGKDILQFDSTTFDFGTVGESAPDIVHEYKFTNTSADAVAILSVSTGCGCTRPDYPVEPIAPGKSGVIRITFQPKGQSGIVSKDIKVRYRAAKASSSKRITLRLRGKVIEGK